MYYASFNHVHSCALLHDPVRLPSSPSHPHVLDMYLTLAPSGQQVLVHHGEIADIVEYVLLEPYSLHGEEFVLP
jgi:hypothetical protein